MADEKDNKDEPREKAVYTKSTAQLDAEARSAALQGEDKDEDRVVEHRAGVNPSYGLEEDGGYIGVNPEYRNAADVRGEPLTSDEDWQRKNLATPPAEDAGEPTLPYVPGQGGFFTPGVDAPLQPGQPASEPTKATTKSTAPASRSVPGSK